MRKPRLNDAGQVRCPRCDSYKSPGDFHKTKSDRLGLARICKGCHRTYPRNANRVREDNWLLNGLRLSVEQYDAMFAAQAGACAICRATSQKALHVDHDHATGVIRGLLCGNCNRGLGFLGDNTERLAKAIEYLQAVNSRGS